MNNSQTTYRQLLDREQGSFTSPVSQKIRSSQRNPVKHKTLNELIILYGIIFTVITLVGFIGLVFLTPLSPILAYFIAANLAAFVIFGYDKQVAGFNATRVPERFFYLISIIGGSVGIVLGAQLFRHKTIKSRFLIWPTIILMFQLIVGLYLMFRS